MATQQRADARASRERLLAAACEVFAEAGPEASLNAVARRAGVGPGTLYRHFPNRPALLAAVLCDRIEQLSQLSKDLTSGAAVTAGEGEGGGADAALARWLRAFLAHARVNQGLGGALLTEELETLGIDCHQVIKDAAARVLDAAQRRGTARADLAADDLVQLVVGVALSTVRSADEDQPERLLRLVLDAVRR